MKSYVVNNVLIVKLLEKNDNAIKLNLNWMWPTSIFELCTSKLAQSSRDHESESIARPNEEAGRDVNPLSATPLAMSHSLNSDRTSTLVKAQLY